MNKVDVFTIGGVFTVFAAALLAGFRYKKTKQFDLTLVELITLMLAVPGCLAGVQVIYLAYTVPALKDLIGDEGRVCMVVGGIATFWFAVGEIRKLFEK
ncbi:hypothetical protein [Thermoleptolyngbya sp.]